MTFRVVIARRAAGEIAANHRWLSERSPPRADRWRDSLLRAVDSLEEQPERYPLAPESEWYDGELRELLHGKRRQAYRILFEIRGDAVAVLRVRHHSQNQLGPDDGI